MAKKITRFQLWILRVEGIVLAVCGVIASVNNAGWGELQFVLTLASFVAMILAGVAIGVAAHELGHLACAAAGSILVYRVVIGEGPLLWRGCIRDVWFEVRRWPLSGHVEPYAVMTYRRYSWALFLLGGALANLAVIGLVMALHAAGMTGRILDFILYAQVFLIAVSIVPMRQGGGNDGMALVRLLWRRDSEPAAALGQTYDLGQVGSRSQGHAPLPMTAASLRLLRHSRRLWDGEIPRAEVRDDLMRELESGGLSPKEKMRVLDTLVTEAITSSDPAARPHLDAWSRQALALGPDQSTLQGSRGAALVELGRHAEGKPLLAPLAAPDQAASYDSFMSRVFLALAEHGLGNGAAARQLADAARATAKAAGISAAVLLARLDREIPAAGQVR
jgi:hypothetical protein